MTVRVSLVRHGQTAWNAERKLLGWTDVPLDAVGETQARSLGAGVDISKYDRIWTSDLGRASMTARLAGWEATPDATLREFDFGELEGLTWAELDPDVREGLAAFEGFKAPGGESTEEFTSRVVGFLDACGTASHLIVTHGGVIRAALRLCGESASFPDHGVIYTIDWSRRLVLDVQTPTT
ncbi:MAG: histidine phosphatase family protein [Acidimicrobiia bacterium]